MTSIISIIFLADCVEVIPTLTQWFHAQWPDYYAQRTSEAMAQDFYSEANRSGLPVRLVAFAEGELAGTITLRKEVLETHPEYTPGLGGLFVTEQFRNHGIGTDLVRAGMKVAREQGYETIYATTRAARGILERLGWRLVQIIQHDSEQLGLYQCELQRLGEKK
jgi:predicted N-acetyltransferase YhbS